MVAKIAKSAIFDTMFYLKSNILGAGAPTLLGAPTAQHHFILGCSGEHSFELARLA